MANPNWVKGCPPPNPTGRPKDELGLIIRQNTNGGKWIYNEAIKLYKDKKSVNSVKVHILEFLTERGWGKPMQQIEHSGQQGEPIQINLVPATNIDGNITG